RSDVSSWVIDGCQERCPASWSFPGPSVLGQVSMIYESLRALGALLSTPPARLAISIRGRFRFAVSAVAQRGTLNATRVHARSSRELREVFRIPGEPKRDCDYACLREPSVR